MEGDFITIKIHHGGSFSKEGELCYEGGEVSNFRKIDCERTSFFDIVDLAKDVEFQNGDDIFYALSGTNLDENLIDHVHDDQSVAKMLTYAKKSGFIELYIQPHSAKVAPANRSGDTASRHKSEQESTKPRENKKIAKKRDKRTWTAEEEKLLIDILYDMNDSAWKVDTGHKSGYLTFIEKEMAKVLPNADLRADPHIKSKVKIIKRQLSYILEIQQNGSGFGWDDENKMVIGDRETYMGWAKSRDGAAALYMKPMVNFEKLCDVYASDLAKGSNAKGPGEQEMPENEATTEESQQTCQPVGGGDAQTKDDVSNPSGRKQGRKRVYPDADGVETGLVGISNSLVKFLESENENAKTMASIGKALVHGVEVQQKASANKSQLFEVIKNLPGFDIDQVVMAVRIIGRDPEDTDLFLKMEDPYKVVFVKQELEAAKKKLKDG